jgi:antitoxin StbD
MPTALLAPVGVTISELKKSPSAALEAGRGRPVAILNHNTPTHYAVTAGVWEAIVEALDDAELNRICDERLADGEAPVRMTMEQLRARRLERTRAA